MTADETKEAQKHPIIVILDDIRSMHNVGSIFRSSDAFAVTSISLCGYTPTPPHRDINKTALGATETVAWEHFGTTVEAINAAKNLGYQVAAIEQTHGSKSLETIKLSADSKIAVVLGNEVTGVCEEAIAASDFYIEIPQWGAKHSLNVSVTAGVVLWELAKQFAFKQT